MVEDTDSDHADDADTFERVDTSSSSQTDGQSSEIESIESDGERSDGRGSRGVVSFSTLDIDDDRVANPTSVNPNPLLKGSLPAKKSYDHQAKALISSSEAYLYFNQWQQKLNHKSTITRLRLAFEQLLPRLLGGRDYAGAAKVLRVLYHRFTLTMNLCFEASLEILRRQPEYRNGLLHFYEAALNTQRLDKLMIFKELWLFHVVHGEFYEAYYLYQDKIEQMEESEEDARLLANFGILCYWLMFIESKQLRDRFKREEITFEEEEEDEEEDTGSSESIESVIESNYAFKPPIGVHILYQRASNALKRAVALSPTSALFLEYYVQLLVLVGEFQPACDYLEAFFHMNPSDPHGPRMLAEFLGCYYPDSVDAQVAAYTRWLETDPACSVPLEKLLELSSAGAVSLYLLIKVLMKALDTCGSDCYVEKNPSLALTLWRNLAELLAAMDEEEFLRNQLVDDRVMMESTRQEETITEVGAQHSWWKRVYLARPNTRQEVVAIAKRDNVLLEVSIYRAAVSKRLFPDHQPILEAFRSAMTLSKMMFSQEHVRLFNSFFPAFFPSLSTDNIASRSFADMALLQVTAECRKKALPVYKGSSDSIHVMDRASIVKREALFDQIKVHVTRSVHSNDGVNEDFLEELYHVLNSEVAVSSHNDGNSRRKRKAEVLSTSKTPLSIPGFVGMVEEEVYHNINASVHHIYSVIHEKLRRSDLLIPTSKAVAHCVYFFRARFIKQIEQNGHGNLLMLRYEAFLARYVRCRRAKGLLDVTKDVAKAAINEMKRVFPSSHSHFPNEELVEATLRLKTAMFRRFRRLRLLQLKPILKDLVEKIVYVHDKTFVDAVYAVCLQNNLVGLITRVDIARILQFLLPKHYYRVLQHMPPRMLRLLTSPEFRKDCNTSEAILKKLNKGQSSRIADEVKVLLWVERYEALYGPICDDEEHLDSDTSSRKSSTDSSSGDL